MAKIELWTEEGLEIIRLEMKKKKLQEIRGYMHIYVFIHTLKEE